MDLWLSSLLFASLLLSSSALTPEECQPLISPISLADPSVIYKQVNFLAGYTDHDFHKSMLNITESSWVNITESPAGNSQVLMHQWNKMNGACMKHTAKVNIEGNTLTSSYLNMTSKFNVLPSCDGCLVFIINSIAKHIQNLLQIMNLGKANFPDEISARSLYFAGRGKTLTESDLEHFKKQASCLGFSGEPDFLYNPEKAFCTDDESLQLPFLQ